MLTARPTAAAQVHYAGSGRWKWEFIGGRTFAIAWERGDEAVLFEIGGICAECRVAVRGDWRSLFEQYTNAASCQPTDTQAMQQ